MKQEITNWPCIAGTSPGNARSHIPPTSKQLLIFERPCELLSALPDTPERAKQEIEIQLALGIPLIAVRGYAAEETREAFARARTLCLKLDNPPEYFQALFGLWGHSWMGGKNDEALSMANEFLSRSRASADPVPLMVAHRVMGSTLLTIGEFPVVEAAL